MAHLDSITTYQHLKLNIDLIFFHCCDNFFFWLLDVDSSCFFKYISVKKFSISKVSNNYVTVSFICIIIFHFYLLCSVMKYVTQEKPEHRLSFRLYMCTLSHFFYFSV